MAGGYAFAVRGPNSGADGDVMCFRGLTDGLAGRPLHPVNNAGIFIYTAPRRGGHPRCGLDRLFPRLICGRRLFLVQRALPLDAEGGAL